jgi:tetratricopeptide (TPR) repeat protein
MPSVLPCPDAGDLERLLHDRAWSWEVECLACHLEECGGCADAADQLLDGEAVVVALRGAGAPPQLEEDTVRRLVSQLRDLRRPDDAGDGTPVEARAADTPPPPGAGSSRPDSAEEFVRGLAPPREPDELGRFGPYGILRVLGSGGMGVVFAARQARPRRVVALKMILAGPHADRGRLARFHSETEIVGRLRHPNIVQVYEAGEHDDRPYFAMEYVDGGSLAQQLAAALLPPRAAAELVEALARAVHFAHEQGVVHRDLKPANVLLAFSGRSESGAGKASAAPLSERPLNGCVPKITDFGLAKRLEEDSRTQTGVIMGTPSYMAPEQAEGRVRDVGPATDVHALGAILYETLTGRPPFGEDSIFLTLEQVRTHEPKPPSRLRPKVPADLEIICLKCLAKLPAGRYATAQALADDLRRFRAGEPILARPVGTAERVVKWVRRRPALAGALALLALAVVALAGLGMWSNHELRAAAERERLARGKAERRSLIARQAVNDMYTEVARQWLADQPHKDELQRRFLDKALAIYQELAQEEGGEPAGRRDTALAYFRIGRICQDLGQRDRAREAFGRAIDLQEQLRAEAPGEAGYRRELAESYNFLGEWYRTGRPSLREAEGAYRQALALQERLAADFPGEPAYRADQARTYYNLGIAYMDSGRAGDAENDYGRAIRILEWLTDHFPADAEHRQGLARALLDRGDLYEEGGHASPAEADYRRAIGVLEPLRAGAQSRPDYRKELAIAYNNLGNLLFHRKRHPEAQEAYRQALPLLDRLADDFPGRPAYRDELANACNGLGAVLAAVHEAAEATRQWQRARGLFDQLHAQYPEEVSYRYRLGVVLGNLGWLRLQQDDPGEARPLLEAGCGHIEAVLAPNPENPDYLGGLHDQHANLAWALVRLNDHAAAAGKAATLCRTLPGAHGPLLAAGFLARCSAAAGQAAGLSPAERTALAQCYADQAVGVLRQAVREHPAAAGRFGADPALRTLRQREDFRQLLAGAAPVARP